MAATTVFIRDQTSPHSETKQHGNRRKANRRAVTLHSTLLHHENELTEFRNEIINLENEDVERRERTRRDE
ncbi:hypothetical protein TRFO_43042 [Tritrichomonas foetus]|uniref:Uncharacterized protein n=1 Tax=Tritrichomonas foetus TaxID=1144522 RepID=A0A1J4KXL8_9EUKA|nr:hypothetical protein TRFO_43042 [Tritrichomonas foetus]|eukprot:OHT14454.1 hypothetical protein TRFO_43042 [Tritrichomonas foetus]